MIRLVVPLATLALVAATVVAAGGTESPWVILLAAISGGAFADLARRAVAEKVDGPRDPTDLAMSLAFLVLLLAGAHDVGRDSRGAVSPGLLAGLTAIGVAAIAGGLWLRRRASRELGDSFTVRLGTSVEHQLIESGPYRLIRHPSYTALLAVSLGTALALMSPGALAAALLVWLPIVCLRIHREEKLLLSRFGASYREYCSRTWRLIPGLY